MQKPCFRPAVVSDLAKIVAMLADDELGYEREDTSIPLNPNYLDSFAAISHDPNQILAVVEYKGDLAGCLQLTFIPGLSRLGMWRGQIESVRIATGFRGKGLGRKMFEWAIAECRRRGCGLVQLTTDKSREEALRFYESLGFTASHEGMKLDLWSGCTEP
jgi:ribosomal protein S18 acetylase RimI-like enzyme